jgi:hypothetical protein
VTICLATKGVLCQPGAPQFPQNTFSPILDFDVELVLEKPTSLIVTNLDTLGTPAGFAVEDTSVIVSTPKGFFVEGDDPLNIPSAFDVEDTDFVFPPKGFAVEDV